MKHAIRGGVKKRFRLLYLTHAVIPILIWISVMSISTVAQTRRLTLDDILNFNQITDIELSPDGNQIAYVILRSGSKDISGEYSTLWLLDLRTREARELTDGGFKLRNLQAPANLEEGKTYSIKQGVTVPRWSPDGRNFAFISTESGSSQVWLLGVNSDEPRQLTGKSADANGKQSSVQDFAFSPDGQSIAYVANTIPKSDERNPDKLKVVAVSGDSSFLKMISDVQRTAIYVMNITSGKTERLIEGKAGILSLQWSLDGQQILFVPASVVLNQSNIDISILSIKSREVFLPARTPEVEYIAALSPDGAEVAFLTLGTESWDRVRPVKLISTRTGAISRISGDYVNAWLLLPLVWQKATNTIYFAGRDKATTRIFAVPPKGGQVRRVTPESFHVRDYSLSADGKRMAAIFENANTPPEIYIGNPDTGEFTCLTKLNPQLDRIRFGHVDKIQWRSRDNRFTVEGFLVKPPDYQPGKKYPLLVNPHGGPSALYENNFRDVNFRGSGHTPPQLYAGEGYLVLLPNKRGDESYSPEFTRAHVRDWGRGDVNNDTEAGVDYLIDQGIADPERLGIMGFSYGAYAAAWAVTQTKRYKAASINDGIVNLISYYGQAYLTNNGLLDYYFGGNPTEQQALYIDRSPITWAGNITTPTLLRYGYAGGVIRPRGTGLAQGLELYRALHQRGVPVELLIHPQEGHAIQDLEVYRDWVERNLRWFNYWVLGKGTNPIESSNSGT